MLTLYLDEDSMGKAFVQALRARGIDVLTAYEARMIERTDAEHLAFATTRGRSLCTYNIGDFYRLHSEYLAEGRTHAGIILMPQQRHNLGERIRRLATLVATMSGESMRNRAEFLSNWQPAQ
jgi:hypothetical protein